MKTDLYTKIVLTVIAVCLTVNLLKEFEVIPTAKANTAAITPAPLPAATQSNVVDVNIVQVGGIELETQSFRTSNFSKLYGLPIQIEENYDK